MRKPALHAKKQDGQAIVLIALVMVILLASLGLAIDGGGMFLLYRDAQNAVDSAALSAAFALCTEGDPVEAGERALTLNGFTDGVNATTANVIESPAEYDDPATTPKDEGDNYVLIQLDVEKPSYFIQVVYSGPIIVSVEAVAVCDPGSDFGWPENSSMISLSTLCAASASSPGNTPPFETTGGASFTTNGGGIYINSTNCGKATDTDGNGAEISAGGYGVCSHAPITGNVTYTENGKPDASCDTTALAELSDPYVQAGLEEPTCTDPTAVTDGTLSTSGVNLPGTYTDFDTKGGDEFLLAPGIYCITVSGTVSFKGDVRNATRAETILAHPTFFDDVDAVQDGVFLFFDGTSKITGNGGSPQLNLHAITDEDHDYAGLLIWVNADSPARPTNNHVITLSANIDGDLTGTVYAPHRHCNLAGQADATIHAQMICYSFNANGGSDMIVYFDPSVVYQVPGHFGVEQ